MLVGTAHGGDVIVLLLFAVAAALNLHLQGQGVFAQLALGYLDYLG